MADKVAAVKVIGLEQAHHLGVVLDLGRGTAEVTLKGIIGFLKCLI